MNGKRLTKGRDKMLAGVCSGIADYVNVDVTIIRVIYALVSLFSAGFPGLLVYIVLAIVMPDPPQDTYYPPEN